MYPCANLHKVLAKNMSLNMINDDVRRVYISGGITDVPDFEEKFQKAEDELRAAGYAVINPARMYMILKPEDTTYEEYMTVDLLLLGMCGAIYQLKGWEESKGAQIEYEHAVKRGLYISKEGDETSLVCRRHL